ncbi:MAG TPA: hypothetical protein V6D19_20865 [Stenomitos sp.]
MKSSLKYTTLLSTVLAVVVLNANNSFAAPRLQVFSGVGPNAAKAFEAMKKAIGGPDNTTAVGPQASGFRTINWDGVTLDGTDFGGKTFVVVKDKTVGIPVDRFLSRGVLFEAIYAVSGDGFVSTNKGVKGQFPFFSPKNTFAMPNDQNLDIEKFTLAGTTTQAKTRGFGAIFIDVERSKSSFIEFFDGEKSLGKYYVPRARSGEPSFLGVLWPKPVVSRVTLKPGQKPIFNVTGSGFVSGPPDITKNSYKGVDLAVTDDFVYAEPTKSW